MSVVYDVLREEYSRLERLKDQYTKELESLPRGTISRKKIRNGEYYYLAYRIKDKVKFDYLGKKDAQKLREIESQIARRKEIEDKLRRVNNSMKEIGKSLRGRK
jgi:hypothetical protein